jgi:hypothetical protein
MFAGIMSTMSIDIVTLTHFLTGRKPRKVLLRGAPWTVEYGCPIAITFIASSRNV